jgi:hypothetical protein
MGNELARFRLLIHARANPSGTYTYVIVRSDDPYWSEMGAEIFTTVEDAAEAGRLAIDRLEANRGAVQCDSGAPRVGGR